jgi:hypothetical protein
MSLRNSLDGVPVERTSSPVLTAEPEDRVVSDAGELAGRHAGPSGELVDHLMEPREQIWYLSYHKIASRPDEPNAALGESGHIHQVGGLGYPNRLGPL